MTGDINSGSASRLTDHDGLKIPLLGVGGGKVESSESIHHPTELKKKKVVKFRCALTCTGVCQRPRIGYGLGGENDFELLDSIGRCHSDDNFSYLFCLTK